MSMFPRIGHGVLALDAAATAGADFYWPGGYLAVMYYGLPSAKTLTFSAKVPQTSATYVVMDTAAYGVEGAAAYLTILAPRGMVKVTSDGAGAKVWFIPAHRM